tara:strand:+ start:93 stop:428 length:336 start_codon:yes stop_codon:yes gene_type:complete
MRERHMLVTPATAEEAFEEMIHLGDAVYFGVCDSIDQVFDRHPDIQESAQRFVVALTLERKEEQPSDGGWRWHKWGEYIGTQEPQFEYLFDEPEIEQVYTYGVYPSAEGEK